MEKDYNELQNKYNNGQPISIKEMNPEEVEVAIHEWAEGSESLENVLKESYKLGFYSLACCVGGGGKHSSLPYLAYDLNDDRSRKIAVYVAEKLVESGLDCKIDFDDDSFFHEQWPEDYPTISLTRFRIETLVEDREKVFGKMFEALSELEKVDFDKIELPSEGNKGINQEFKFKDLVEKALRDYPEMIENQVFFGVKGIGVKDKSESENVEWDLDDWE